MGTALHAAGDLLLAWSVGLAATTVLVDQGPGMARDHPPAARRWAGIAAGPLAFTALICFVAGGASWLSVLLAAPFSGVSALYSLAWWRRVRADQRRTAGWQAAIGGVLTCLVSLMLASTDGWHPGLVIAVHAGSAAVLGGLAALLLKLLFIQEEHPLPAPPTGIPTRVIAVGLGLIGLAVLDLGFALLPLWPWLVLTLAVPLALGVLGQWLLPRLRVPLCMVAMLSALSGQILVHDLMMKLPVLIPAPLL